MTPFKYLLNGCNEQAESQRIVFSRNKAVLFSVSSRFIIFNIKKIPIKLTFVITKQSVLSLLAINSAVIRDLKSANEYSGMLLINFRVELVIQSMMWNGEG